ncbi:SAV_915 family protein [Cellulomonas triticagri]|uniref:SseB protein N-terminal domain-containing protein n=1 Tax=Cellulomonas triticagri TaxID=2483352 RepID=A0A3M2JM52_9CELL|nr:SAV_915 family protein [Cellulomonas triticagri]RMI13321.1 hypothetical protein EBM89_04770 [Cellulomonas triticagri]
MPDAPGNRQVPPVLYVPCETATTSDGEARLSLRTTRDGRIALLAYTALDRLVTCCGPDQPWVLVPTDRMDDIARTQQFDVVYLDLMVPEVHRVGSSSA